MKKEKILINAIIFISILLIFTGGAIAGIIITSTNSNKVYNLKEENNGLNTESKTVISKDDINNFFIKQEIIKDLPKDAVINFRILSNDYSIKEGVISYGYSQDPDLTLTIPDYYANYLSDDLCKTIEKAYKNKDVKIDINKPKQSLVIKYKSLYKYKNCMGL